MRGSVRATVLALLAATLGAAAPGRGWSLSPAGAAGARELTFSDGSKILYRLSCGSSEVAVSQYGVTGLLDLQTNTKIADGPGSAITPGAALMALATDKVQPNLVPAAAAANPAGGWDLTIRLRKEDPSFLSLAKARVVSLFTTGFTTAVELDKADRKLAADFVAGCKGR